VHPLLAAGFANAVAADRPAAARRRAVRRGAARSGHAVPDDAADRVVIRSATRDDASRLVALGTLDGDRRAGERLARHADERVVLVSEIDGELLAALAIDSGLAVADPFRPSALHARLLRLRARQLGGEAPRRARGRLGLVPLRTSS
jgi:hypothetical protein